MVIGAILLLYALARTDFILVLSAINLDLYTVEILTKT